MYGKFIESNLTIFRAADPGIVHVYHEIICDPNLPPNQLVMCLGTKSSSYASTHQVGAMPVRNYRAKSLLCCGKMCTLCAKFLIIDQVIFKLLHQILQLGSFLNPSQMAAKVLQTKEILLSDEENGAGLEGAEPEDIAVQDTAVLEQMKQENAAPQPAAPAR